MLETCFVPRWNQKIWCSLVWLCLGRNLYHSVWNPGRLWVSWSNICRQCCLVVSTRSLDRLDPHRDDFFDISGCHDEGVGLPCRAETGGFRLGSHSCTRRESQQTTTYWPGSLVVQQPGLEIEPKLLELLNSLTMFVNICGSLFGHLPKSAKPYMCPGQCMKTLFWLGMAETKLAGYQWNEVSPSNKP